MTKKPVSTDRDDDLTTPDTNNASDVIIRIDKKGDGYDPSNGRDKTASNIAEGNVKVFLNNNEPKNGFKRYMHKVKGGKDGEYRKISDTGRTFKNNTKEITSISVNGNVNYVYVYFGGNNNDKPLLIAICKDNNGSCSWKYYRNNDPTNADSINWPQENGISGAPGNSNHTFLMHLDKLNDQAIQKDVIHIEKTPTSGTIAGSGSNKIYKTGSQGNTTITVAQGGSNVPTGYVAYSHDPGAQLTNVKFRHNGELLKGFPGNITIEANKRVWIFYEANDTNCNTPLLLYYQQSSNNNWYGKGKKWEHHSKLTVDASTSLPAKTGADGKKIASKLNDILERQGAFSDLKCEHVMQTL